MHFKLCDCDSIEMKGQCTPELVNKWRTFRFQFSGHPTQVWSSIETNLWFEIAFNQKFWFRTWMQSMPIKIGISLQKKTQTFSRHESTKQKNRWLQFKKNTLNIISIANYAKKKNISFGVANAITNITAKSFDINVIKLTTSLYVKCLFSACSLSDFLFRFVAISDCCFGNTQTPTKYFIYVWNRYESFEYRRSTILNLFTISWKSIVVNSE